LTSIMNMFERFNGITNAFLQSTQSTKQDPGKIFSTTSNISKRRHENVKSFKEECELV